MPYAYGTPCICHWVRARTRPGEHAFQWYILMWHTNVQLRPVANMPCTTATVGWCVCAVWLRSLMQNAGSVVGCKSACDKFNTDEYCCRGAYGKPSECQPSQWPTNYCAPFWAACPHAYAYAYDDHRATFTCSNDIKQWQITFCPWFVQLSSKLTSLDNKKLPRCIKCSNGKMTWNCAKS